MRTGDVPVGEGRSVVVEGAAVAVFHLRDGSWRALGAVCPHRGGPLADGLLDLTKVVCPLHNRAYDLATGVELTEDGPAVPTYQVTVQQDEVVVSST